MIVEGINAILEDVKMAEWHAIELSIISVVNAVVHYIAGGVEDVGADIFDRGLCLPSDNKMTAEEQDRIIEVIRRCFE